MNSAVKQQPFLHPKFCRPKKCVKARSLFSKREDRSVSMEDMLISMPPRSPCSPEWKARRRLIRTCHRRTHFDGQERIIISQTVCTANQCVRTDKSSSTVEANPTCPTEMLSCSCSPSKTLAGSRGTHPSPHPKSKLPNDHPHRERQESILVRGLMLTTLPVKDSDQNLQSPGNGNYHPSETGTDTKCCGTGVIFHRIA